MSHELEYAVKGALLLCDKGSMPSFFHPSNGEGVKMSGLKTSNSLDKLPNEHIRPFGTCGLQNGKPCTPIPLDWQYTYGVKINGGTTLLKKSCIECGTGGNISFLNSGQVPLPQEQLESLLEESGEKEDDNSWDWWDTAELIPVVGNLIGMVREAQKGNWVMFALNVAFLILDVGTLGTASLATATVKGGVKAGIKATAKKVAQTTNKAFSKNGIKKLRKGGANILAKGIAKATAKLATARGVLCVTACFKKGTLIATENGQVPIENIKTGNLVWSFEETSGKQSLKKVVSTFHKEVDATIELSLENEIITTTSEHPFYTKQGWKQASELTQDDAIITKQGTWHKVKSTTFKYEKETVYNFEVADFNTYFVGVLMWLVHNAKICLSALAKAGVKYAKNILNGKLFDKSMRKAYGASNSQIKLVNGKVVDVIKNNELISHKFTQLSDVTFKTAKGYVDEIGKKYANQTTKSRKFVEQLDTSEMKKILEIPPQKSGIPEKVLKYADRKKIEIRGQK